MRVEYHPLTVSDLNDAVVYYNQQRAGLGEEFRSEVYAAIARIRANSSHYAVVEHDIRRCFVHRFPYSVLFRLINEEVIRILIIRHHRRHPSLGLGRR
ncbi:MAG: type II toxin-antitoxin system RelE/ParE family toxin [Chromatiales bacterium]